MKSIRRLTLASVLAVAVLAMPSILAAAKELATLTVSGPGINGTLALNDAQGMLQLQQYGFFDTSALSRVPQNLGEGYLVTGYLNLDGNPVAFEQGIYYPAIAGEQAYIHFTGAFDGTTMKTTSVDRWGVVTPQAAAAFSSMVAARGVTLQSGVQARTVQLGNFQAAPPAPSVLLLIVVVGAAAALLAGGMRIRRRRPSLQ